MELNNLKFNPFANITPSIDDENLVWVQMKEIKEKIENSYKDCLANNSKQIILNWGQYGGGKTFTAYYFKNLFRDNFTNIYLRCPKDGAKSTDELFKNIIDCLTFEKIHNRVKELNAVVGQQQLLTLLSSKSGSEYAKAILLIGSDDEDIKNTMNRFLYSGLTKTDLKKLGLAKDIQTSTDLIKFLAGIIYLFTFDKGRVAIWLDEMEDLIYYSPKHYKTLSQVLRDLFDSIPNNILFFMNFTLAESEESTIELILGGAVWSRITKKIRYKQFSQEDALNYCKDLLNNAIVSNNKPFPIADNCILGIIIMIPQNNLTPREINKHFTSFISFCNENGKKMDEDSFNNWVKYFEDEQ